MLPNTFPIKICSFINSLREYIQIEIHTHCARHTASEWVSRDPTSHERPMPVPSPLPPMPRCPHHANHLRTPSPGSSRSTTLPPRVSLCPPARMNQGKAPDHRETKSCSPPSPSATLLVVRSSRFKGLVPIQDVAARLVRGHSCNVRRGAHCNGCKDRSAGREQGQGGGGGRARGRHAHLCAPRAQRCSRRRGRSVGRVGRPVSPPTCVRRSRLKHASRI